MMKHKLHPFEDMEDFWHQNSTQLLIPDEIQDIFHQLDMTPATYIGTLEKTLSVE